MRTPSLITAAAVALCVASPAAASATPQTPRVPVARHALRAHWRHFRFDMTFIRCRRHRGTTTCLDAIRGELCIKYACEKGWLVGVDRVQDRRLIVTTGPHVLFTPQNPHNHPEWFAS